MSSYESCDDSGGIYSTQSQQDLVAGHRYCHGYWNDLTSSKDTDDYKYDKSDIREEHARLVRCMKKNDMEHNSPLED